ncbi:MAG: methyl-accepting chemotaxis protein [Mariniblastus sp.]
MKTIVRIAKNPTLQLKLLLLGVALPGLIISGFLYLYSQEAKQKAISTSVDKARSICLASESAREQTEKQWGSGIFTPETLKQWGHQGEMNKVMSTIPVVTAWETAMNKSDEGGYKFNVPALEPRNSQNLANEFQRKALDKMKSEGLEEYYAVDKTTKSVHYFRPVHLGGSCLNCHGDPANANRLWGTTDGTDVTGHKMENWSEGRMHGAFEVVQSLEKAEDAANASISFAILIAVISLIVAALATVLTMKNLTKRISNATGVISNYVKNLRISAEDLSQQSAQTSQQTNAMEQTVINVSENIASLSTAVDQMGGAIDEIANESTQASLVAETAVGETENTKNVMSRLGESCSRIDGVVSLINSLAEQTNLLALNATIEAARAGESGKGFAVVANEVKELANQTGQATVEISEVICSIQGDTTDAIESVQKIHTTISKISSAQQAISVAVGEQSNVTHQISQNVADISNSSSDIADRIKHVSNSSQHTSEQVVESTKLVAEIETTASNVPQMIGI